MDLLVIESLSTAGYVIIAIATIGGAIAGITYLRCKHKRGLPNFKYTTGHSVKVINQIISINFIALGTTWNIEVDEGGVKEIIHYEREIQIHYDDKIVTYYGEIRIKTESISD